MMIMTAKLSKKKLALCLLVAAALLILVLTAVGGDKDTPPPETQDSAPSLTGLTTNEDRVAFLTACGYTAEPEPVLGEVSIPKEFNEVFTRYNTLQQSQGFDLTAYAGKRAKRYVYQVTKDGETASATLIIYRDTVIAADLSSTEGEGFLRALLPPAGTGSVA